MLPLWQIQRKSNVCLDNSVCKSNNFGLCFRRPAMKFTESRGCWAFILRPLWWGQYLLWGTMGKSLNLCMSGHTYIFFPNTPQTPESEKEGKTSMFLLGRAHCLCITYQSTTVMAGCFQRWAREFRCHSTVLFPLVYSHWPSEDEIAYILYFLLSWLTNTCEGASELCPEGEAHVQVLGRAERTSVSIGGGLRVKTWRGKGHLQLDFHLLVLAQYCLDPFILILYSSWNGTHR